MSSTLPESQALRIDPRDNVAVALDDISAGAQVGIQGTTIEALDRDSLRTQGGPTGNRARGGNP